MKKFFSLMAAVLFAGSMMAGKYGVTVVSDFVNGGQYVFYQDGHVLDGKIDQSKIAPTTSYAKTGLEGTESYVWTVEQSDKGWLLKTVDGKYLANASKGNLSLVDNAGGATAWTAAFSGGTVFLTNAANSNRFLGLNETGTGYKAYSQDNLETYAHDIVVYHLEEGATGEIGDGASGGGSEEGEVIDITGLVYAEAYLYTYEGYDFWDIDLYKDYNSNTNSLVYPEVYFTIDAESTSKIAGEYEPYYVGYWKSAKDSVEMDGYDTEAFVNITYNSDDTYTFVGQFKGEDGNTYKFTCTTMVDAYDSDNDYEPIVLDDEVAEGIEDVVLTEKAKKVVVDGNVFVIRDNKMFNVTGTRVR
jgi:hypothetical protein